MASRRYDAVEAFVTPAVVIIDDGELMQEEQPTGSPSASRVSWQNAEQRTGQAQAWAVFCYGPGGPDEDQCPESIEGKIIEVIKGQTTAHVRIDAGGTILTASITNEAGDELGLEVGQHA